MPHIYSVRREREEEATRQYLAVQNQAAERRLRAEQDAAYERAAANDRERIERKRREIEDAKWRAQQEAENMLREAERIRSEVAEKSGWRIWEEHHFGESSNVPAFNDAGGSKPVRVVLRMPTIEGRVWMLSPTTSITSLYARVDSLLLASTPTSDSTPLVPPLVSSVEEAEKILDSKLSALSSWNLFFPFTLHLAYPRTAIPWTANTRLMDVEELRKGGGGVIVVELDGGSARSSFDASRKSLEGNGTANSREVDSDGYESEE
jgi:FAS-associated factor 2